MPKQRNEDRCTIPTIQAYIYIYIQTHKKNTVDRFKRMAPSLADVCAGAPPPPPLVISIAPREDLRRRAAAEFFIVPVGPNVSLVLCSLKRSSVGMFASTHLSILTIYYYSDFLGSTQINRRSKRFGMADPHLAVTIMKG